VPRPLRRHAWATSSRPGSAKPVASSERLELALALWSRPVFASKTARSQSPEEPVRCVVTTPGAEAS
jgi:hypothetical protein